MKYPDDFVGKVIQGDCLTVMKDIPDKSIDLILTDPPYNIKLGQNQHYHKRLDTHPNIYWDNMTENNYSDFIQKIIKECLRISHCTIITCGIGNQHLYPKPKWTMVWRKMNAITISPLTRGQKICKCCWDPVLVYGQLDNPPMFDIIDCPITRQPMAEDHPCPKPIRLFSRLISFKNGIVLDPMCGSGTTVVAAKELGRRFIGIEISEAYCKIARDRLAQEMLL